MIFELINITFSASLMKDASLSKMEKEFDGGDFLLSRGFMENIQKFYG